MMGATKKGEMYRTAEMLVDIAQEQGVYYAFALYYDSGRHSTADLKMLLDILQNTRGSIKKQRNEDSEMTVNKQIEKLEEELESLRTPVDSFGKTYLGIANHDPDRVRKIRKELNKLENEHV